MACLCIFRAAGCVSPQGTDARFGSWAPLWKSFGSRQGNHSRAVICLFTVAWFFSQKSRRNWLGQYPECIQQISRKGQEGLDVLHLYNQRGDDFLCPQRCHVLPKCAVPLEPEEGNNKCWTRRHVIGFTNDTAVGVESTMWCRFHGSQATAFDSARIVWHEHVLLSSFTQAGKRESVTLLFQGSGLYYFDLFWLNRSCPHLPAYEK